MSKLRSHIKSITMLNWRGIPFQILEMDRLITALEGNNGAGKTTILTAFYVSLLPDASLVKIPNVGDTEGFGKESGVHGKLSDDGPAYTILELVNPLNERILAGVQLNARTAPDVDMSNTFVITKIPANVPLERLLIFEKGDRVYIPEISHIEQSVGIYGGDLQKFDGIAKYGAKLFELGILPVDLHDKKDREKFNRLLQTSLLGGFSQKLQERLKDYLLPDDTQTRDSVSRMKASLDGCRRTKKRIENLSKKIEVVAEIHSNSRQMMEALFSGIKLRERKLCCEVEDLRDKRQATILRYRNAYKAYKAAKHDAETLKDKVAKAEAELTLVKALLEKTKQAHDLSSEIATNTTELAALAVIRADRQKEYVKAKNDYLETQERISTLNDALADVSKRLASAQEAWNKISMEAGLYQSACQCLENAQNALPEETVSADSSKTLLEECEIKKAGLTKISSDIELKLQTAEESRKSFQEALTILEGIAGTTVPPEMAWHTALKTVSEFKELKNLIEINKSLADDIPKTEEKATKQGALKAEIQSLQEHNVYVITRADLSAAHSDASEQVRELNDQLSDNKVAINLLAEQMKQHESKNKELKGKCLLWDEAVSLRSDLESKHSAKFTQIEDVSEWANNRANKEKEEFGKRIAAEQEIKNLESRITEYLSRDNDVDAGLEKLAKELDGKLVISLYEYLEIDEAAEKEARLGPLVNAIMVADVQAALQAIEQMNEKMVPEEVWLVEKSKLDSEVLRYYKKVGKSIVAQMDKAWRVTRFPDRPKVGHQARRQKIADMRSEKDEKRESIKKIDATIKTLQEEVKDLRTLAAKFPILTERSPYEILADLEFDIIQCKDQMDQADFLGKILRRNLESKSAVFSTLGRLVPDGYLLDEEDLSHNLAAMKELLRRVDAANVRYSAKEDLLGQFDNKMYDLKAPPPSEEDCANLRAELATHKADWAFWSTAFDTLTQLIDKIEHFKFEKSFTQLQTSEDPAPELRKQQEKAAQLQKEESAKLAGLQEAEALANKNYTDAATAYAQKQKNILDCEEKLAVLGVEGSEKAVYDATTVHNKAELEFNGLTEQYRQMENAIPQLTHTKDTTKHEMGESKKKWHDCNYLKYKQAQLAWEDANTHCQNDKTLTRLLQITTDQGSAFENADAAFAEANTQRRFLEIAIKKQPILEAELQPYVGTLLMAFTGFSVSQDSGKEQLLLQKYLALWKEVIVYISQILPRDCVHTDNPDMAIEQMSDSYKSLTHTLEQQEKDFQVDSEAVANSIKSKLQSARSNIRKHNTHLDGMSFGNIRSIMIESTLHEDMVQILDVMQRKDQWDMFAEDLPLHEVMKKIYSHKVGGTVQGDELLDYKKYIKLSVKIQRKSSNGWESSFMSTGEAIGTGAAILMVILMTWENSASFFRDRDHQRSMRFLLMDEATRLDKESIKNLLDFCRKLDIQFLLAGPKFEAEECGDGTTYTLKRKNTDSGEHVLIRGRKGFGRSRLEVEGVSE